MTQADEPFSAPASVSTVFDQLHAAYGLSYRSFTVMKQAERDAVLASFSADVVAAVADAVSQDDRKIHVRRLDCSSEIERSMQRLAASQPQVAVLQGIVVDNEVMASAVTATAPPATSPVDRPLSPSNDIIFLADRSAYPTPPPVSPSTAQQDQLAFKPNFAGILNQGNTCYLSSLLQALFHVPYFRGMMMYRVSASCSNPIPIALRNLFMQLELKTLVSTKDLTDAFGWGLEEARQQHDVHELAQVLFDSLESILKDTPDKDVIKSLFYGSQTYYTRCLDVDYTSRRQEGLYDVELTVKGYASLASSFEYYVKPEKIDSKYCWEHDDGTKSYHEAERGVQFDRLPPVLMVHPNRVDFDMERMERVTVTSEWAFPTEIDMAPFVQGRAPAAASSSSSSSEPSLQEREDSFGELESTEYVLRCVVIHSGTPTVGHYVCYVRMAEDSWVLFDDDRVSHVTAAAVLARAFSSPVTNSYGYTYPASARATLLLYLNKSVLGKLLACPEADAEVLKAACKEMDVRRQERETVERLAKCRASMKYILMDDAGEHLVYLEDNKADQHLTPSTVTYISNFSPEVDEDPVAMIAKDLKLAPSDIAVWSYHYLPLYAHSDGAVKYVAPKAFYSGYASYSSYTTKFVQVLAKPTAIAGEEAAAAAAAPDGEDLPPLVELAAPTALYHARVWNGTFFKFAGVCRSKADLMAVTAGLDVPPPSGAAAAAGAPPVSQTHPVVPEDVTVPATTAAEEGAASPALDTAPLPPAHTWRFYTFANSAVVEVRWDALVCGANVVVAPSHMAAPDVVQLLSRKVAVAVDIARLLPNGTMLPLGRLALEQKAPLDVIQQRIFGMLAEQDLPRPASPLFVGIRDCDADGVAKAGVAHTQQTPFYAYYCGQQKTTLQSLLQSRTGTGQARLCVDFLPVSMAEVDARLHINVLFNFSAQYRRYVLIDAALASFEDMQAEAVRQWRLDPAAPAFPDGSHLRLLCVDYWGKLKAPATFFSLSRHETYMIDVVLAVPPPPAGEPDVQPVLVNVQHVNRYSGEAYFGCPTNTYVFPRSERETGEEVLKRVLDKLEILEPAAREVCLRTWKVCVRLPAVGVKVLGRTELLATLLPAPELPLPEISILLDHLPHGSAPKAAHREHAVHIRHATSPVPPSS